MGMEGWNSQLLSFRRGPSGVKVPIGGSPLQGSFGINSICFLGVHMMMCHCFLLDGKKQAVDFDYLSPVIKMSVCIFVQIISTEMLVQKKLEYISGCYHVLRLQSRKNQGKKTEFFKTPVKQVKQ